MSIIWEREQREFDSWESRRRYAAWLKSGDVDGGHLHFDDKLLYADLCFVFGCITDEAAAKIESIMLVDSHASDEQGVRIAQIVANSTRLTQLVLKNNHFTERTMEALKRALLVNSSVRTLVVTDDHCAEGIVRKMFAYAARRGPARDPHSRWINPRREIASGRVVVRNDAYRKLRRDAPVRRGPARSCKSIPEQ